LFVIILQDQSKDFQDQRFIYYRRHLRLLISDHKMNKQTLLAARPSTLKCKLQKVSPSCYIHWM
jgi:hypothetical protein